MQQQTASWYRAATLPERIASQPIQGAARAQDEHRGNAEAEKMLQRWKAQEPFDNGSWFTERLAMDAITEQDLLALLAEPLVALQERLGSPTAPGWLIELLHGLHARLTGEPLKLDPLLEMVRDPRAGAVVTFLGVTREVAELEYEAYAEMAEPQMAEIVARAIERHGLCAAAVEHRVGTVPLSEPSVAIAVSAPHREAAFAGAREIIDELKARVPIWKKEEGEWVRGVTPQP